ncbi:MAG: hypothetical protein IVW57_04440 [Ktedonobacterales bacterium]|nr:hypothetical protein [Ktedonobacterales bacterium]
MNATIHQFRGKTYDPKALEELVAELIAAQDVRKVYEAAEIFALVSRGDYAHAEGQLKESYGRKLNTRQLQLAVNEARKAHAVAIKEEKRAQTQAAKAGTRRVEIKDVAPEDPRPRVCLNDRELVGLAGEIIGYLTICTESPLYQRDIYLVRVRAGVGGKHIIETIEEDKLSNIIAHTVVCYHVRVNEQGDAVATSSAPPRELVRFILAQRSWPFPRLEGIAQGPVVRPDGTVCAAPGYDAATALYCAPSPDFVMPELPAHPTQEDAKAARAFIEYVLQDVCFADRAGLANIIATALTVILRASIKGNVPLSLVDATRQGSAKTILASWALVAGTGLPLSEAAYTVPWTDSKEEQQKRLETALMDGATRIFVDNIRGVINLSALEDMLTLPTHACRRLGKSEQPVVSSRATWVFTGNGLRPSGDLYRRIYYIHLDAGMSRPEERDPRRYAIGDMEEYLSVPENRAKLLGAILTMYLAWHEAGRPSASEYIPFGSFQEWTNIMGGILEYAGVTGFLATHKQDKESADEDSEEWEPFLLTWHRLLGSDPIPVRKVAEMCGEEPKGELAQALPDYIYRDLGSLNKSMAVSLGNSLRNRNKRPYGKSGIRAERCGEDKHNNRVLWRVLLPEDDAPTPAPDPTPTPSSDEGHELRSPSSDTPSSDTPSSTGESTSDYAGQPWYRPASPDSPASQAMQWACGGDVMRAAGWLHSDKLRERFAAGGAVIRLTGQGDMNPAAFTAKLREMYTAGQWKAIRAIAQTLGADAAGVLGQTATSAATGGQP